MGIRQDLVVVRTGGDRCVEWTGPRGRENEPRAVEIDLGQLAPLHDLGT